jgi:hypothetical protein
MLLAVGQPPKVVSEILGHSTVAFTMDVYTEVAEELADAAAEALSASTPRGAPEARRRIRRRTLRRSCQSDRGECPAGACTVRWDILSVNLPAWAPPPLRSRQDYLDGRRPVGLSRGLAGPAAGAKLPERTCKA